jgi:hypothetical protein
VDRSDREPATAALRKLRAGVGAPFRGSPWRYWRTGYKEQWLRLLAMAEDIKAFIEANNDNLKSKE